MKKAQVIKALERALESSEELIKAAKGEPCRCGCKTLESTTLYIGSWIKAPIEEALAEIKGVPKCQN